MIDQKEYDNYPETLELVIKHNWHPSPEFWKQHNKRKIFNWILKHRKKHDNINNINNKFIHYMDNRDDTFMF